MVCCITVTHHSNPVTNIQIRFKEIGNETRSIRSLDNSAPKLFIDENVINVNFTFRMYAYEPTKRHAKMLSQLTYYGYQKLLRVYDSK